MPAEKPRLSLGEAIPLEQARVRGVLAQYLELGPPGAFGAAMIEADLRAMDHAVMSGDVITMLRCYRALQEIGS